MDKNNKEYPINGFAPGFYSCKCVDCKKQFMGDKRAVQCEPCATKAKQEQLTEIPKEEIEERRNKAYTQELKPNKSAEDKMQEMLEYILNDKETALGYLQTFMDIAEEYSKQSKWIECECGHFAPEEFIHGDSDSGRSCANCLVEHLQDLLSDKKSKWISVEEVLNIVDSCFHCYASDYRVDAKEYAKQLLPQPPKQ